MTTLQRDLRRRIKERHTQWIYESLELFDAAGISNHIATAEILTVVVDAFVAAAVIFDIPAVELTEAITKAMKDRASKWSHLND